MAPEKDLRSALKVRPGSAVDISAMDPVDFHGWQKAAAEKQIKANHRRLGDLQDRLWAEAKHAILIVLQGIDASGKDGSIQKVMDAFNPMGCQVTSFKVPTAEEAAHDFLWRIHKRVPAKGEIGIFNRSHYEEVLIVRVHNLVPKEVWSGHYEQLNDFEELLTGGGTTIVKFFLNISRDEQRKRIQERYDNPTKRWKFSTGDLEERALWDDYMAAYQDVLAKTSTPDSPWYAIPANKNWFRDLAISHILAEVIGELKPEYPAPANLPKNLKIE